MMVKLRFCSRCRSEAQKTVAKRAVGAILRRRHIHRYVEEQNRVANNYTCNGWFCFIQRVKQKRRARADSLPLRPREKHGGFKANNKRCSKDLKALKSFPEN